MSAHASSPPRVSVIVCSRGRAGSLRNSLLSLARQQFSPGEYEVVVVDNNPSPDRIVQDTVGDVQLRSPADSAGSWSYLHCPAAGLSNARNAGVSAARGDICSFIDDDASACPDWLQQVLGAFDAHADAGVIGGHVILQVPEPRPRVLRPGLERYWSQFITPYEGYTEVENWGQFPWGANWSARRHALLAVGGFRAEYGRTGDDYWGGEELVAALQIHALGYKIAVIPQAQVLHAVDAARFTRTHLWRTILASTLVAYRVERDLRTSGAARRPGDVWNSPVHYWDIAIMRLAAHLVLAVERLRDSSSRRLIAP